MKKATAKDPITGSTIRWTYEDGPTAGKTFEHTFAEDGTVSYRIVDGQTASTAKTDGSPGPNVERPRYEVARINDGTYAVSYLAPSGFTLTTILDLDAGTMVSVASNEKELFVQRGTFEKVR